MTLNEGFTWWTGFVKDFYSFYEIAFIDLDVIIETAWEKIFNVPIDLPSRYLGLDISIAEVIVEYIPLIMALTVVAYIVRLIVDIIA